MGRKPLLLTAAIGYIVQSVPATMLLGVESLVLQCLGLAVPGFLILVSSISSVSSTRPARPTAVCYTGFALAYNFSTEGMLLVCSRIAEVFSNISDVDLP